MMLESGNEKEIKDVVFAGCWHPRAPPAMKRSIETARPIYASEVGQNKNAQVSGSWGPKGIPVEVLKPDVPRKSIYNGKNNKVNRGFVPPKGIPVVREEVKGPPKQNLNRKVVKAKRKSRLRKPVRNNNWQKQQKIQQAPWTI